ncbi:hypothetical protein QFZ67_000594 [Streptomyces sp. V1I1]|nr:hypothetical protein [Streptomyces sp. V1I1]
MDLMADRDLVVEAVAEDEAAKLAVFARLDATVQRRDAILATNPPPSPSSGSRRPPRARNRWWV